MSNWDRLAAGKHRRWAALATCVLAETAQLTIGPTEVQAHSIQVIAQPIGLAALDDVYGVLGMDFLNRLKNYTFDYRTMELGVRTE